MNEERPLTIIDSSKIDEMKQQLNRDNRIKYLIEQLTNKHNNFILGNTRFFHKEEIDKVVLNKEIGEQIHKAMLKYDANWKHKNILLQLVNKNLLARWSFDSKSKEELITLGIGSFREESREEMTGSFLSKIPLVGRVFK